MDININKDIARDYPSDVWKGFTLKQLLCILVALVLGATSILVLYFGAGTNIHVAVYISIPIVAPVILMGFAYHRGLPLIDYVKERIRLADQPDLYYQAEENHYLYLLDKPEKKGRKR